MKSTEELLTEAEQALLATMKRHDPIRHEKIYSAISFAHQQVCYAIHLHMLAKKDPVQNIPDQLREMPLIDNKSKGAGPDND